VQGEVTSAQRYLRYALRVSDADMHPLSHAQPRLVGYWETNKVSAEKVAQLGGSHYRVLEQRDEAAHPWLSTSSARGCPLIMRSPSSAIPLATSMPLATLIDPSGQSPCSYGENSRLPLAPRSRSLLVEVWLVLPEQINALPDSLRPRPRAYL
jgi:hypothetical protein